MKKGKVIDYRTGEVIVEAVEDEGKQERKHIFLTIVLYLCWGLLKFLGICLLGVFGFLTGCWSGIKK